MDPKSLNVVARQLSTRLFKCDADYRRRRQLPRSSSRVSRLEALEARLLMHSSPVLDAEHLAVFGRATSLRRDHRRPGSRFVADLHLGARHTPEKWSDPSTCALCRPGAGRRHPPSPIRPRRQRADFRRQRRHRRCIIQRRRCTRFATTARCDSTRTPTRCCRSTRSSSSPSGVFQMGTDPTQARPAQPDRHGPANRRRQAGQGDLCRHRADRPGLGSAAIQPRTGLARRGQHFRIDGHQLTNNWPSTPRPRTRRWCWPTRPRDGRPATG